MATNTGKIFPLPEALTIPNLPPNLGTIAMLAYSILYVLLEPVAGGILFPILLSSTALANWLVSTYGWTANKYAIATHVACWLAQFVGHGIFEGRAPALLDNLVQAVFLAPLFVWLEVLFFFGYRPELKSRLEQWAHEDVSKYKASKESTKAVNGNGDVKSR